MGCSWLAVQNPHDILSGGDCSDGEREGKSQLFESGHAENGSTAGGLDGQMTRPKTEAAYGFSALLYESDHPLIGVDDRLEGLSPLRAVHRF